MKLSTLLYENREKQIEKVAKKVYPDQDIQIAKSSLTSTLKETDTSGKYWPWILRQIYYKNINWPEDMYRVHEVIKLFKRHQPRLAIRDINRYRTIFDLEKELDELEGTTSKRQGGYQFKPESLDGVKLINQKGDYKLYTITDTSALEKLGEGTKWCTRGSYPHCQAEAYIGKFGNIFLITKNDKPYIQITSDFREIEDTAGRNVELDNEQLELVREGLLKNRMAIALQKFFDKYMAKIKYGPNYSITEYDRWPEAEPIIMKNPKAAYQYIQLLKPDDAKELALKYDPYQDPKYAVYIANFIGERLPKSEKYIMKDPEQAVNYAGLVLKDRWPEAEKYIAKDPYAIIRYPYRLGNF